MKCQVTVDLRFHDFLNHQSYIDCLEPRRELLADVEKALVRKPENILGNLNDPHIRRIKIAVEASPRMIGFDKRVVLAALTSHLEKLD